MTGVGRLAPKPHTTPAEIAHLDFTLPCNARKVRPDGPCPTPATYLATLICTGCEEVADRYLCEVHLEHVVRGRNTCMECGTPVELITVVRL